MYIKPNVYRCRDIGRYQILVWHKVCKYKVSRPELVKYKVSRPDAKYKVIRPMQMYCKY